MTDPAPQDTQAGEQPTADSLQRQLDRAHQRLIQAELKAHATRAGMLDLDGLKLLDLTALTLDENGNLPGAEAAIARLKQDKPWAFARANTSHPAAAPSPQPQQTPMAQDMTHREWQIARQRLIQAR